MFKYITSTLIQSSLMIVLTVSEWSTLTSNLSWRYWPAVSSTLSVEVVTRDETLS